MSRKHFMAAAAAGYSSNDVNIIPLRDWMATEIKRVTEKSNTGGESQSNFATSFTSKESLIRKTTIAYGILESILRCPGKKKQANDVDVLTTFDNFSVHVAKKTSKKQPWDDIKGVSLLSLKISLMIEEPAYLSCLFEPVGTHDVQYGRHLEVEVEQTSNESEEKEKKARNQIGAVKAVEGCSTMHAGRFSGCGKSMLVDTLRARVNVVGGYVIKHKFDALAQERGPLSGVISAVNQLCTLIKSNRTAVHLAALAERMKEEFGADVVFLSRILQSLSVLSSDVICSDKNDENSSIGDTMNARSVGYTLLRFMRLVSSRSNPIMLFLDDLQWADDTALDVVHTFLSDTMGSCIFFVGTYRDNEVDADHPVFDLMKKLESSNVPTSKVALAGLNREDLNTMISDAFCLYPRMCYSLTDIVIQKTRGNPFFMLEFMNSLKDRGLLQYNIHQRRWVWDEEVIRYEDVTDNVMHLLSHKMTGLSDILQLVLKVMACFGTYTNESVIDYLDDSIQYAGLREGLRLAADGGFVEKSREGEYKFVHDKIREAAYNLIPESNMKQFHCTLGTILHSVSNEKDKDDSTLIIASQLYLGKECIPKNEESYIPMLKLMIDAGKKSIESCHHETAYTYLEAASSLLPDDCWERYYDMSLRLYFMMAIAANGCCKYDAAEIILKKVLSEGRCVEDKLSSYYLLIQILQGQEVVKAYSTCSSILTQLGETVPESVSLECVGTMLKETLKMYHSMFSDAWLEKKMDDFKLQNIVKFYGALATCAYFCKAEHVIGYYVCKMTQLSLIHGPCPYTPIALLRFSNFINRDGENATLAYHIAKNAMSISKKFVLLDQIAELDLIFVHSVGYLEWLHLGVRRLRGGFESLLSIGNANIGFLCAAQSTIYSIISGEKKLTLLLKEVDYYLQLLNTYKSEMTRRALMICRKIISTLIDNGKSTGIEADDSPGTRGDELPQRLLDLIWFTRTIENYWLGYSERCCHFAKKYFSTFLKPVRLYRVIVSFYHGLNLLDMLKKKSNPPRRKEVKKVIESMKVAVSHADVNFKNKLELLEAELYGLDSRHTQAVAAYDAAIASAENCKFVHEQGLSCEKAGYYYIKIRDYRKSMRYFDQARSCYDEWGSRVKVEMMEKEINTLNSLFQSERKL